MFEHGLAHENLFVCKIIPLCYQRVNCGLYLTWISNSRFLFVVSIFVRDSDEYTYLNVNIKFNNKVKSVALTQVDYFTKITNKYSDLVLVQQKKYPQIGDGVHHDETVGSTNKVLT